MTKYRVTRKYIDRPDGRANAGDVIEPTEAELNAFADRLEPVQQTEESVDPRASQVADEHWQTVVTAIEEGECDEFLDDLAEIDDRSSVQDAIAARR